MNVSLLSKHSGSRTLIPPVPIGEERLWNPKPRLVFFHRKYDKTVPEFLLVHMQEHVKCLREFFDVAVVNRDCDYLEICDTYQPDIAVFEVGPNLSDSHRLKIKNVKTNNNVIKVALHNSDAWCETRSGIISELEHWDIANSFSIAVTAPEHTPSIAGNLFVWPNFIDPEIFSDYGERKVVEMLLTGARAAQYPWRKCIFPLAEMNFRAVNQGHPGYFGKPMSGRPAIHGEPYARAINSSIFAPTCGTVAKEVVRKHFEIPGCRTCLITEQSPGLVLAGYVDMVNCVFAEEGNLLDKVNYLLKNPERLQAITDAGYDLVHSRHTYKQRDQIFQWYTLQRRRNPGDVIVQPDPFEPPRLAEPTERSGQIHLISGGRHLALMVEGDELLAQGEYSLAAKKYAECLAYMRMLPEARLRIVICKLCLGHSGDALSLIADLVGYTLAGYKARDPDPVEWAYYIVALLCCGKYRQACTRAGQFRSLHHIQLDRIRKVLAMENRNSILPDEDDAAPSRVSIHRLPDRSFDDWLGNLIAMLETSGQHARASRISDFRPDFCNEGGLQAATPASGAALATASKNSCVYRFVYRMRLALHFVFFRDPVEYFCHRRRIASVRRRISAIAARRNVPDQTK